MCQQTLCSHKAKKHTSKPLSLCQSSTPSLTRRSTTQAKQLKCIHILLTIFPFSPLKPFSPAPPFLPCREGEGVELAGGIVTGIYRLPSHQPVLVVPFSLSGPGVAQEHKMVFFQVGLAMLMRQFSRVRAYFVSVSSVLTNPSIEPWRSWGALLPSPPRMTSVPLLSLT